MKKIFLTLLCAAVLAACGKSETPDNPDDNKGGNQTENGGNSDDNNGDNGDNSGSGDNAGDADSATSVFYKGSTMCFASYMQDLGLVYRENGEVKDPYESMKEHGANIVRLQLNFEDFSQYEACNGASIDWATYDRVLADALKAKAQGLDIMLTLKPDADIYYEDKATDHNRVPAAWRSMNDTQIAGAVYDWVYTSLENLAKEGILPVIVAVGNELNVEFMAPVTDYEWNFPRIAARLKPGLQAVRDYQKKYNPGVKSLLHIAGPSEAMWFVRDLKSNDCADFDVVGLSWYPGEGIGHKMGNYSSFKGLGAALKGAGYEFMILETAYTFVHSGGDKCNNSYNYPAWNEQNSSNTSPAAQREWLAGLAADVRDAGGIGVITWGTESLPDDGSGLLYTYPAESWAHGSTWENNSYWDFTNDNNLHEGIDWMLDAE